MSPRDIIVLDTVPGKIVFVASVAIFAEDHEIEGVLKRVFGSDSSAITAVVSRSTNAQSPSDAECRLEFPFNNFSPPASRLVANISDILEAAVIWFGQIHQVAVSKL